MNNKRTITTREQIKINGEIRERTATHSKRHLSTVC